MLGAGSGGRATGRPLLNDVAGLGAAGCAARAAGFETAFFVVARGVLRLAVARFAVARFAVAFLAVPRFAVLRLAVVRFAVVRFAVDFFLPPARFAVDRLAVDFFDDFFFAGISPPFGYATSGSRVVIRADEDRCCYLRVIASASGKDKHLSGGTGLSNR